MYMKFGLVALVLAVVTMNHYTPETTPVKPSKPIALVKYKDVVYQCQGVINTTCGYSIHCGNLSVHCVDKLTIEYLE